MSCTWTIFEGEKSLKGERRRQSRSSFAWTAKAEREEMGNLTIDKVKDERANTERLK